MKILETLLLFFYANLAIGQSITDQELNILANNVVNEVKGKMSGANIAVADFVDSNGEVTELGNYLAEEF